MVEIVREFWQKISERKFDDLASLFLHDAKVYLPNTREIFETPLKYIEFNKAYPGRWVVEVERLHQLGTLVISTARVVNPTDRIDFYVTSYFEMSGKKIREMTEFWGENSDPPDWRANGKLSVRY